jgi:hypothetical protein
MCPAKAYNHEHRNRHEKQVLHFIYSAFNGWRLKSGQYILSVKTEHGHRIEDQDMKKQNDRGGENLLKVNIKIKEKLPGIKVCGQKEGFYGPEHGQIQGGYHRKGNEDRHCGEDGAKRIVGQA